MVEKQREKETENDLGAFLDSKISSKGEAELAVLHLFHAYHVEVDDLIQKRLNVSHITYREMAPRVGLSPFAAGRDMESFDIHRARIPTSLFKEIVKDLEVSMKQYGEANQLNEEARSRYLAPLFGRLVGFFDLTMRNTLGSVLPDRLITKGRFGYHYVVLGRLSLIVVEWQYVLGRAEEYYDAIAQVIAECDACDFANDHGPAKVYGILCNGSSFEFFSFDRQNKPPTFCRGVIRTSTHQAQSLVIANYHAVSKLDFMLSLRPICETIFFFFLLAYKTGIQAHMIRSTMEAEKQNRPQASTPDWKGALVFAEEAFETAVDAAAKAAIDDITTANEKTEMALESLQKSLSSVPGPFKREVDLLRFWDEERIERC